MPASARGFGMRLRTLTAWAAVCAVLPGLFLAGCSGPRKVRLSLAGTENLNSCGGDQGNALRVRVYKLSGDSKFSIASQEQIWRSEAGALAGEVLQEEEYILAPGQDTTLTITIESGDVSTLGVAGNFCETKDSCWKWWNQVSKIRSFNILTFGETCILEAEERMGEQKSE
jgi:type VI secretion system VasD/TssJ family lipoprotein